MKHRFTPGPRVVVDGVEYYEITGYGIWGKLLIQTNMIDDLPLESYNDFIDAEIGRQLEKQRLILELGIE